MPTYDPNKKQTISSKDAYKLGLIDKQFSGSVRRSNADIAFAQGKNIFDAAGSGSNPKKYNYNVPNKPSTPAAPNPAPQPSAPKREKATAVNAGINSMGSTDGYTFPSKPSNFKTKGAISKAAGGTTEYSLDYKPTKANVSGLEGSGVGIKATKMAEAPSQSAPKSRKEMRQERRVARLEKRQAIQKEKGELALSEGRTMDAKQKRYRYNRLQERIDRNKNKMQ